jgi:hypothetical protein
MADSPDACLVALHAGFDELRALMTGVLVLQAVQLAAMIAIALALNMR